MPLSQNANNRPGYHPDRASATDLSSFGVNLQAFASRFAITWIRLRVSLNPRARSRVTHLQLMASRVECRTDCFMGRVDDCRQIDRLAAKLDLSATDPRDVKQIVDQPGS